MKIDWETTGIKLSDGYELIKGEDKQGNQYEASGLVRSYDFEIEEIIDIEKV